MEIKITDITIDHQALIPTLSVYIEMEFETEIPLNISGRLKTNDGKVVSLLNENQSYGECMFDQLKPAAATKFRGSREVKKTSYRAIMSAQLLSNAIEHIELQREKDNDKSVKFELDFIIKHIERTLYQIESNPYLFRFQVVNGRSNFTIKHSDWVKKYSPHLGIGNFLLLELQIPDERKVSEFWKELYSKLVENLSGMEACLRNGDWVKTMFLARKFYENIKIGDKKPGHKKFQDEFSKLLAKDQHGEEGIQEFFDAIWKFFEFVSKYVHEKDKSGNFNPVPVSTKEDAYFAYALALGLVNLIGKKTNAE